jgi:hypothetical protein
MEHAQGGRAPFRALACDYDGTRRARQDRRLDARVAAAGASQTADRVISLVVDEEFKVVGHYYADFVPVRDDEVVDMLARAAEHVPSDIHDAPPRSR